MQRCDCCRASWYISTRDATSVHENFVSFHRLCRILNIEKAEEARTEIERERGEGKMGNWQRNVCAVRRGGASTLHCIRWNIHRSRLRQLRPAKRSRSRVYPWPRWKFICTNERAILLCGHRSTSFPRVPAWKKSRGRCAHSRPPLFVYGKQGNSRGRKNIAVPRAFDRKFGERVSG